MSGSGFAWPNGAKGAVSLSFDDARLTQPDVGIPLLDKHGVKATFYVCMAAFEQKIDQWKAGIANGHEIGCHTVNHPCSGNFRWSRKHALEDYTLKDIEKEMLDANDQIEELSGVRPTTFAYPCGQTYVGRGTKLKSYIPVVAKHFEVGRGFLAESVADPTFCDLAYTPGVDFDRADWDGVKRWIDRAVNEGGWITFVGHEVSAAGQQATRPETLERICTYCTDPKNGVWIDTVAAVGAYIKKNRRL